MVIVLSNSTYSITVLSGTTKLLCLGKQCFEWSTGTGGRQYLKRIHTIKVADKPKCKGNYWLFDVGDKPGLTPGVHLSIVVAPGTWEAFILQPGLPTKIGETCVMTTTDERIANPRRRRQPQPTSTASDEHWW